MSEKVVLERTLQPAEPAAWVSGLGQPGRATSKRTGLVVRQRIHSGGPSGSSGGGAGPRVELGCPAIGPEFWGPPLGPCSP